MEHLFQFSMLLVQFQNREHYFLYFRALTNRVFWKLFPICLVCVEIFFTENFYPPFGEYHLIVGSFPEFDINAISEEESGRKTVPGCQRQSNDF